jgi:iron complex transport system permease protein
MSALSGTTSSSRGTRVVRAGSFLSLRYRPRYLAVSLLLALAAFGLMVLQLGLGDFPISPGRVLATLQGHGTRLEEFIVYRQRMPRAATAIVVGIAFGVSGALFQCLTRNPLGSPDIIGFTQGASFGAVVTLLIWHGSPNQVALGATIGGLLVSALVYVLAYRQGVQGYRLILVGVTAVLSALVSWLLLRGEINEARFAFIWLTGSLNGAAWPSLWPVVAVTAGLLPAALAMSRRLRLLEMGDETAQALGVRVESSRLILILVGTGLCAVVVSAAGPISFIALAAPQIARRVTGTSSIGLVSSALMGALLLLFSDLAAQQFFGDVKLPVGAATLSVGGAYLAWLIFHENRAGRG